MVNDHTWIVSDGRSWAETGMIAAQAPRNRKNAGIVSSKKRNKWPAGPMPGGFECVAWWRRGESPARASAIQGCGLCGAAKGFRAPVRRLILANRSAPLAGSTPHRLHQAQKKPTLHYSKVSFSPPLGGGGGVEPRPKILYSGSLRAFPVIWVSSPGTLAGKVPFGPSREKARPSAPREEASGYPVRVTSSRLYGHSAVGGRRLKPPELTDSRWRLLVSRFLRGAGPRHATHEHRHPRRSRFAPLLFLL